MDKQLKNHSSAFGIAIKITTAEENGRPVLGEIAKASSHGLCDSRSDPGEYPFFTRGLCLHSSACRVTVHIAAASAFVLLPLDKHGPRSSHHSGATIKCAETARLLANILLRQWLPSRKE